MRIPRILDNAFTSLLSRCGIEPCQYWLLVGLFDTLSQRQELARIGSHDHGARIWIALMCFFATAASLGGVAFGISPDILCWSLAGLTAFQLSLVLLPEVAENLVNPVEGLVLAHQPVSGSTWLGAKLTHLVKFVAFVVAAINVLPAVIGCFLDHQSTFLALVYPAKHLLVAFGLGLLVALLCCSLFGWLALFIPARRLKRAAVVAQVIPMLLVLPMQFHDRLEAAYEDHEELFAWSGRWATAIDETVPGGWATVLGIAAAALGLVAITIGLRSLSRDHLIRASALVQSGTRRRRAKKNESVIGQWSARIAGGQAGRAGFEYLGTMMLRDWQFKVNIAGIVPLLVMLVVLPTLEGQSVMSSPFGTGFALSHLLPHALGLVIVSIGLALSYGNDYKGTWWFLLVPATSVLPFARGVHARLVLLLVVAPSLVLFIACMWHWNAGEAVLFVAFSSVVASLYLAFSLHLITGIPFGKQRDPGRRMGALAAVIIFLAVVGIGIGVQYLLFLSEVAVVVAVLVGSACAYFLTGMAIQNLRSRIQTHIDLIALRPGNSLGGEFVGISE